MGASAEYVERTEGDKTVDVVADDSLTVGASRTQIVGKVHEVGVTGAQTYSVAAGRSLDVASSMAVEAGSESVMVGGVRSFDVGGDYSTEVKGALSRLVAGAKVEAAVEAHNRHVTGAGTHLVGGTWNELSITSAVSVGGTHVRAISGAMAIRAPKCSISAAVLKESFGPHTINAGAAVVFQFSSAATVSFGAASTLHGGGMVAVVASSDLTIDAGGTTIKITPSAITIDGPFDGGVPAEVTGTEETT